MSDLETETSSLFSGLVYLDNLFLGFKDSRVDSRWSYLS